MQNTEVPQPTYLNSMLAKASRVSKIDPKTSDFDHPSMTREHFSAGVGPLRVSQFFTFLPSTSCIGSSFRTTVCWLERRVSGDTRCGKGDLKGSWLGNDECRNLAMPLGCWTDSASLKLANLVHFSPASESLILYEQCQYGFRLPLGDNPCGYLAKIKQQSFGLQEGSPHRGTTETVTTLFWARC